MAGDVEQVEFADDDLQTADLAANQNFSSNKPGCEKTPCPDCNQPPPGSEIPVLCSIVCACDANPPIGADGQRLPQVCVKKSLWAMDDALGNRSRLKGEVPYDMTQQPPTPYMSRNNPNRATRRAPKDSSIPDVVVVKDGCKPPVQSNIAGVYEIKFPPDYDSRNKEADYRRIAGLAPFGFLSPNEPPCECNKKQPEPVPVPVPAPAPAPSRQQKSALVTGLLVTAAIGLAVVSALLLQPEGELGAAGLFAAAF